MLCSKKKLLLSGAKQFNSCVVGCSKCILSKVTGRSTLFLLLSRHHAICLEYFASSVCVVFKILYLLGVAWDWCRFPLQTIDQFDYCLLSSMFRVIPLFVALVNIFSLSKVFGWIRNTYWPSTNLARTSHSKCFELLIFNISKVLLYATFINYTSFAIDLQDNLDLTRMCLGTCLIG